MKIFKCEECYRTDKRLDGCIKDNLKCVVCNGKMSLAAKKDAVADVTCDALLAKLVTLQDQYIKFIGEELEETAILAAARGWKSKRFDEGVKLRTEMEHLKGKLG